MRISSGLIRGALLTAAVAIVPSVAQAGSIWQRHWALCVSGAFNTCHSVYLKTTDIGTATAVEVRIRNLQGSGPPFGDQEFFDNAPWSGLRALRFYGTGVTVNPLDAAAALIGGMATTGGATTGGASPWNTNTTATSGIGILRLNGVSAPDGTNRRIGGCSAGVGGSAPVMFTCWGEIVFSFQTATLMTASQLTGAYFSADMPDSSGTVTSRVCQTDATTYTGSTSVICDTQIGSLSYLGETSAVPEPVTIALLGSGLVGIAGARRRKKNTTEE